jgi:hypothetical protein
LAATLPATCVEHHETAHHELEAAWNNQISKH